ncbi:neuroblast differentiation-associated protein AHNAK-like [Nerophis ophidion]|uniref:neuroblast differentiation-associated protein AHNAK-like n=1 Tax=Nerophis ophidion TaxID=159077 RepID=UPI002AE00BB0|nr:neuroblast differentiation-associated protein AHNAK-like [Nerophis ophidion]
MASRFNRRSLSDVLTLERSEQGALVISSIDDADFSNQRLREGDEVVGATINFNHLSKDEVLSVLRLIEPYDDKVQVLTRNNTSGGLGNLNRVNVTPETMLNNSYNKLYNTKIRKFMRHDSSDSNNLRGLVQTLPHSSKVRTKLDNDLPRLGVDFGRLESNAHDRHFSAVPDFSSGNFSQGPNMNLPPLAVGASGVQVSHLLNGRGQAAYGPSVDMNSGFGLNGGHVSGSSFDGKLNMANHSMADLSGDADWDADSYEGTAGASLGSARINAPHFDLNGAGYAQHSGKLQVSQDKYGLEGPSLDVKTADLRVNTPRMRGDFSTPGVDLASSQLHGIGIPTPAVRTKVPSAKYKAPKFTMPKFDIPIVEVPGINGPDLGINAPKVDLNGPNLDFDIDGKFQKPNLPNVDLNGPKLSGPNLSLNTDLDPKFPNLSGGIKGPHLKTPKLKTPTLKMPDMKIKNPKLKLDTPDFDLPNVDYETPKLDLNAPDFNIGSPDAKLNMPKLKMPKFGRPNLKGPDIDADLDGLGVDINAPNMDFKTPKLDLNAPDFKIGSPDAKLNMPKLKMPKLGRPNLTGPDIDADLDGLGLDINAPNMDLKTPKLDLNAPDFKIGSPDAKLNMPKLKMPKFGRPNLTGPDIDADLDGLGVDINAPNMDFKTPKLDLNAPDFKIGSPDAKLNMPKLKMPKFGRPNLTGPDIDADLDGLGLDINAPNMDLKTPKLDLNAPTMDIKSPNTKLHMPKLKMPKWKGWSYKPPKMDADLDGVDMDINAPKVNLGDPNLALKTPDLDFSGPNVDFKNPDLDFSGPNLDLSHNVGINAPHLKMPKFKTPKLDLNGPNLDLPSVDMPDLHAPDLKLKTPHIKGGIDAPNLDLPNVDLKAPKLDMKTPNLNIGSPKTRFKFPKLKLPKLRRRSLKAPDLDADLDIPDVDIEAPQLNLKGPNADLDIDGRFKKPKINLPKLDGPNFDVKSPDLKMPKLDLKKPKLDLNAPKLKAPKMNLHRPEWDVEIPSSKMKMPKLKGPKVDLLTLDGPDIDAPDFDINAPDVNLKGPKAPHLNFQKKYRKPHLDGPDLNLKSPTVHGKLPQGNADLNVRAPKIKGSFDTPGVDLPDMDLDAPYLRKSHMRMPSLDFDGDVHGPDLRVPGVDIKGPNMKPKMPSLDIDDIDMSFSDPRMKLRAPDLDVDDASMNFKKSLIGKSAIKLPGMGLDLDQDLAQHRLKTMSGSALDASLDDIDFTRSDLNIDDFTGKHHVPRSRASTLDLQLPSTFGTGTDLKTQARSGLQLDAGDDLYAKMSRTVNGAHASYSQSSQQRSAEASAEYLVTEFPSQEQSPNTVTHKYSTLGGMQFNPGDVNLEVPDLSDLKASSFIFSHMV